MKDNKSRFTIFVIIFALLAGVLTTFYVVFNRRCVADGTVACYDKDAGFFKVEEGAYLNVQVESDELGEYLVSTWDALHPENKGAITYSVKKPYSANQLVEGIPYDVIVTSQETASYYINDFLSLDSLESNVSAKIPNQISDMINYTGYYFTPNSISGNVFVYNETLMKELGYDLTDEDHSGLPDIFDSWEQIFEMADDLNTKTKLVFPFTLEDQNMIYPFLTGGSWSLFFTNDSMNPGFKSREFNEGLALIEDFSKVALVEEKKKDEEEKPTETDEKPDSAQEEIINEPITDLKKLPWQFEEAFYKRRTLFSILDPNDEVFKAYSKSSGDTYRLAPMPRYKNHILAPMASVNGYAVNKDVKFPSAASEVIRILRSPEAILIYQANSSQTVIYNYAFIEDLKTDDTQVIERIRAYNYHDTPSVLALKGNPQVLARSIWREIDIMPILEDLYNHKITRDEAQAKISELSDKWYEAKEIIEE